LFSDTPQTLERAKIARNRFTAAKIWLGTDWAVCALTLTNLLRRDGLGPDSILLVDPGQIWEKMLMRRLRLSEKVNATWLEEPFNSGAWRIQNCRDDAQDRLAGGEAAHIT
jgi:L-alanine-DL-glutamate epimerase-like enolase superfamily enzyme